MKSDGSRWIPRNFESDPNFGLDDLGISLFKYICIYISCYIYIRAGGLACCLSGHQTVHHARLGFGVFAWVDLSR